jgi:arylsulfatase A-like enzyme
MNVIYLVSHDTGRYLGCYGRPITVSPNLDRFAAENVRFAHAFCQAPCCGPSRCCAMTGMISHRTGTIGLGGMGWDLPAGVRTLVDDFNDAGYVTAHIGFCHERRYGEMRYQVDGERGVDDERYWKCDTKLVIDNAIDWLTAKRDPARPFYLNLATNETHLYSLGKPAHGQPLPPEQTWVPPSIPDTPAARELFGMWYAELRYFDHHVGRLLAAIDELGLRESTLVVITTDHGIGGHRSKGHLYEAGVETYLLARLPGGARRSVVDHLIPNIDLRPTILDACGLGIPEGIDGRSFLPLLSGRGHYRPRAEVFLERSFHGEPLPDSSLGWMDKYDPQRSIRTPDLHYIRHCWPHARPRPWFRREIAEMVPIGDAASSWMAVRPSEDQPRPSEELYDLRHDPWEQDNLANRPEYQEAKRALAGKLDAWMRETGDPALRGVMPQPLCESRWPWADSPVREFVRG